MTTEEKAELETKARALFAQGMSVNAVAGALFKGHWARAKQVKDAMDGGAPAPKKKPPKKDEEEGVPIFEVRLEVPTARLDDIFAEFTPQEKADAIAGVLQARMDAVLEPATT